MWIVCKMIVCLQLARASVWITSRVDRITEGLQVVGSTRSHCHRHQHRRTADSGDKPPALPDGTVLQSSFRWRLERRAAWKRRSFRLQLERRGSPAAQQAALVILHVILYDKVYFAYLHRFLLCCCFLSRGLSFANRCAQSSQQDLLMW